MGRLQAVSGKLGGAPSKLRAAPKVVDRFYQSREWKALRRAKLDQGPASCCVCGAGGKGVRLILDHREERKDGGADLPMLDELDWYCTGHHNAKTAREKARRARER